MNINDTGTHSNREGFERERQLGPPALHLPDSIEHRADIVPERNPFHTVPETLTVLSSLLTVPSFHSILRLGLQTIMVLTFSLRVIATICKGLYQGRNIPTPIKPSQVMTTYHRCWFRDIDFFMHMNNAMYFRHFELARWELLPRTGLLQHALKENWMFLAVEQDCKYLKMVRPLTKFECRSSITIADNKWLDFHHSLWSMDGKTLYSEGMVRAVVKRRNGKTVRPSEFPEFIAPNNAIEH